MKILKCQNLLNWRTVDHGVPRQGIMMSSQALFESDKQVIIWCYKVRTVAWMWHHCPTKTYGLCGAHLCVALHYHRVTLQTFCQMNSTNASLYTSLYFNTAVGVHCCSHSQDQENSTLLIPNKSPSKVLDGQCAASTLQSWCHTIRL